MVATNAPDGQINSDFQNSCQARESKIFLCARRANQFYNSARPTQERGVRTSRTRGGMRWTPSHEDERGLGVRRSRVVPAPECWRQVREMKCSRAMVAIELA